jgi:hypothetical protein
LSYYPPLELKWGWIFPNVNLQGFYFLKISPHWPNDCRSTNDLSLQLLLLLSKSYNIENGWKDYVKKCITKFSRTFNFQIFYDPQKDSSFLKITNQLKPFLSKKELAQIEKIYSTVQSNSSKQDLEKLFIKHMQKENKKEDELSFFYTNQKILKAVKDSKDSFFGNLLTILVAMRSNIQAWIKKLVIKFINMGPDGIIFLHDHRPKTDPKLLKELFSKFLAQLDKNLENQKIKDMFFLQITHYLEHDTGPFNVADWELNWSFKEVQENFKSPNYGFPHLGFWVQMYIHHTFMAQVDYFVKENLTTSVIKKWGQDFPWLFTYYLPEEPEAKKQALKVIESLIQSENFYHKYLVLNLLNNKHYKLDPKVLDDLKKKYPQLNTSIPDLKRHFFLELLQQGKKLEFALYHLLKLNSSEFEKSILWWITFSNP